MVFYTYSRKENISILHGMENIRQEAEYIEKYMFRLFSVYPKMLLVYTSTITFIPIYSYSNKKAYIEIILYMPC